MATAQKPLPLPPAEISRQPVYSVWPPRVESRESLDLLTAEIARLDALAERVKADTKDEIAEIQRRALDRLTIELEARSEETPLTLVDWREALRAAAEKWCTRNRESLLEDGRKSFDNNYARIGWKDAVPALEPLPDFDDDGNQKILAGMLKELRVALQKIANEFVKDGARFVDVKLEWRKKALLTAHTDQELPLPMLKKTGFTVAQEEEKFYIKPQAGDVASQSAERPR